MPLPIPPRRIAAHRIACKALYRALLAQVPRIPISNDVQALVKGSLNPLHYLIRKSFKSNIYVTSPRLCVQELERGYAAETLLRNAGNGDHTATTQIQSFLQTIYHQKAVARQRQILHAPSSQPRPPKPRVSPFPGAPKVHEIRPLPEEKLSGRRRIPVLTAANWIPFLRFKKPQSEFLSRVIRGKINQKQRRFEGLERCEQGIEMGAAEGEWETTVVGAVEAELGRGKDGENREMMRRWLEEGQGRDFGALEGRRSGRSSWEIEASRARSTIFGQVGRETAKAAEMGKKLLGIVEKERELWELERLQRKDRKKGRPVREALPNKEHVMAKEMNSKDIQPFRRNAHSATWRPRASF